MLHRGIALPGRVLQANLRNFWVRGQPTCSHAPHDLKPSGFCCLSPSYVCALLWFQDSNLEPKALLN
eukprot:1879056-Amphidinium_carterae.1